MAEIIGIVASSFELGRVLVDLNRFCTAVKDAPNEVVSLLDDAARTNRILQLAAEEQKNLAPFLLPRPEWDECREACKATANELSSLVTDLQRSIHRFKLAGSLRCVLKKEVITSLRQRLESAKSTLSLAEHTFNR